MKTYTHVEYSVGFATRGGEEPLMTRPGWFARVILRRKPQPTFISIEVGRKLAAAMRQAEEDMIREIFGNGAR